MRSSRAGGHTGTVTFGSAVAKHHIIDSHTFPYPEEDRTFFCLADFRLVVEEREKIDFSVYSHF